MDILKIARKRNSEQNITGVLLYSEGTFIQALEGDEKTINDLFSMIESDPRHKNIIKLVEKPLSKRFFPDWTMGFALIDKDKAREITGFLTSTDGIMKSDGKHTLTSLLKSFIESNNLRIDF